MAGEFVYLYVSVLLLNWRWDCISQIRKAMHLLILYTILRGRLVATCVRRWLWSTLPTFPLLLWDIKYAIIWQLLFVKIKSSFSLVFHLMWFANVTHTKLFGFSWNEILVSYKIIKHIGMQSKLFQWSSFFPLFNWCLHLQKLIPRIKKRK